VKNCYRLPRLGRIRGSSYPIVRHREKNKAPNREHACPGGEQGNGKAMDSSVSNWNRELRRGQKAKKWGLGPTEPLHLCGGKHTLGTRE
jgi:hypothetical protein